MFTYINENFLHAPSTDLSRDTVKTLINITLAQAQEIFLEKQTRDGKKSALLAKLAAQAHFLYSQAKEGLEADSQKNVFDASWLKLVQVKAMHTSAVMEYYQALAEDEGNLPGSAIARLQIADKASKQANTLAKAFPSTPSPASNLGTDTTSILQAITKRQMEMVQEKLTTLIKDNDFIYHQTIPAEASLVPVVKMPAAKAIPVSELYQGQDIQRIIGPDIFQKIVPMSVTESASMYDEEKAKLVRSEAEKVEQANGEMAASLDYLKLPNSLNVLKGGMDQEMSLDPEFERWCRDLSDHEPFSRAFDQLQKDKMAVLDSLNKSTKQLDMEESVCEKMRSKYSGDWTQQPSSRLTSTLRGAIKNYRDTIDEASNSDVQLLNTARQFDNDFEEMRKAGEQGEADVLYQQAMIKAGASSKGKSKSPTEGNLLDEDYGEGGPSVSDQIAKVEDLLRKLNLVKRERTQVLKDLKEKIHNDDISHVLILNRKSMGNQEGQLFQAELEKFRSHQNRLISTVHKQQSLLKDLTKTYGDLLQDKRVRSDQQRFEGVARSKNTVLTKYKRVHTAHEDLIQGLLRAQGFYSEMKESVDSLEKNVDGFVSNRRAEGAQLLAQIEQSKSSSASGQAAAEHDRLQKLMARMSMEPSSSGADRPPPIPSQSIDQKPTQPYSTTNADPRFTIPPRHSPAPVVSNGYNHPLHRADSQSTTRTTTNNQDNSSMYAFQQSGAVVPQQSYNPMAYPESRSPPQHPAQRQNSYPKNQTSPSVQGAQMQPSFFPPQSHTPQPYPQPQSQQQHPHQSLQSPVQSLNFASPGSQYQQHYNFPQQTYQQFQQHSAFPPQGQQQPQQYPGYSYPPQGVPTSSPYNVPQNYVPPPPPPGPPGGSSTQYPPNSAQWASGPGGYANYARPGATAPGTRDGNVAGGAPTGQQGQNQSGDPWAGLSAWK